ncbi:secretory phospholipase A2 receptor-like [Betta splendens]|uniref:Secretory phospholipase A2 receptor-like n=1 Tax=Betta splendens TaxID=158456 RepID=A0A6P7LXI4_BETSP|nr:secretory phospholipase A2 receptor-like [Betta splendens]
MKTSGLLFGVLCLSGCLIFSTCFIHKYHFININSTWNQAQTYCKTKYIDLATINNITEVNQFISTVSSAGYNSKAWIGIYVTLSGNWINAYSAKYLNWRTPQGSETFIQGTWCGYISSNTLWYANCTAEHPFICDNGTQKTFVNVPMDYLNAWSYCKGNLTDLTAPFASSVNVWLINVTALVPSGQQAWFGWIGFKHFFWSDLSPVSFNYWNELPQLFDTVGVMRGAADLQRSGIWSFLSTKLLPFVCYTEQVPEDTIKVLKLRVSSSTDVNDFAVEANILSQLQMKFMKQGLSGASLKWRKQPDGKIFLKKGNSGISYKHECQVNC